MNHANYVCKFVHCFANLTKIYRTLDFSLIQLLALYLMGMDDFAEFRRQSLPR